MPRMPLPGRFRSQKQRVCLHVGVPKSGTTFLQASLAENQDALRDAGFLYPVDGTQPMFRGALDVLDNPRSWGRPQSEVEGAWAGLCRTARRHRGTTIISHELLAAADERQIARARSALDGLEVHVVVTARDPARQVTAEWQEGIKHGRSVAFEEFRSRIMSPGREHEHARRFWAAQDLPDVLARWTEGLPPEQVHVVCCPPPGSDPQQLWRRFGDAVGFDADAVPVSARPGAANASLGTTQIALLRRVNAELGGRLPQPGYGRVVKRYFTKQLLARHPSPRPQLPPAMYEETVALGEEWIKRIGQAGYTVHGELSELLPPPPVAQAPHPDDVDVEQELATAAAVLADLLVEVARLRSRG